jgi:hypothetical protein
MAYSRAPTVPVLRPRERVTEGLQPSEYRGGARHMGAPQYCNRGKRCSTWCLVLRGDCENQRRSLGCWVCPHRRRSTWHSKSVLHLLTQRLDLVSGGDSENPRHPHRNEHRLLARGFHHRPNCKTAQSRACDRLELRAGSHRASMVKPTQY